jgi:hypothetical protein
MGADHAAPEERLFLDEDDRMTDFGGFYSRRHPADTPSDDKYRLEIRIHGALRR